MRPAIDLPDPIHWLGIQVTASEEAVLRAIAACWDVFGVGVGTSAAESAAVAISALVVELNPNRRRPARQLAEWRFGLAERDHAWSHVVLP